MGDQLPIVERLQVQIVELKRELQQDIPKALEEARAHGDLKENAEYHAAKERQGMLSARIGQMEHRIGELSLYSISSIPRDRAGYGSRLTVADLSSGEELVYELVFPEEADPSKGQVSLNSPVGQAFINKREGDEVNVRTPSGKRAFEVIDLVTFHDR
jgi:transcription elongation factor GreA